MVISIASGKGGTGKTGIVAAFASLAADKVLSGADVDAADLHLIMNPQTTEWHDFQAGHSAVVNVEKCTACGLCGELCRYNAISKDFGVNRMDCEGCGVCGHFCPEKAIDFPIKTCWEWHLSQTRFGRMVHARLGIAEENSGKLVTLVREEAKKVAESFFFTTSMRAAVIGSSLPLSSILKREAFLPRERQNAPTPSVFRS